MSLVICWYIVADYRIMLLLNLYLIQWVDNFPHSKIEGHRKKHVNTLNIIINAINHIQQ